MQQLITRKGLFVLAATLCLALGSGTLHAGTFTFDFLPDGGSSIGLIDHRCGSLGNDDCDHDGGSNTPDTSTPWVQEYVTKGGIQYWHTIVGDPLDGFAQDVYIQRGTTNPRGGVGKWADGESVTMGDGGGFICDNCDDKIPNVGGSTNALQCWQMIGFACNPLGYDPDFQGNGYQNPTKVAMKQISFDSELTFDFEKSEITEKPIIIQTVTNAEITIEFKADMSAGNYGAMGTSPTVSSDMSAPDVFVNKLTHADGNPPQPPGQDSIPGIYDFDYAHDTTNTALTAGQFTWTAGQGWSTTRTTPTYDSKTAWSLGGTFKQYGKGTYSYIGGVGLPIDEVRWDKFMDASQNPCGGDPFCNRAPVDMPAP